MNRLAHDLAALRAINKRFTHNFVTSDVRSHDALMHPQFRTITPGGGHFERGPHLEFRAHGFDPAVPVYRDMRDERIEVLGDAALVTATNKWAGHHDGQDATGMTCDADTCVRAAESWLRVLAQLTPVAPDNCPGDDTIVVKYPRGQLQPRRESGA